MVRTGADVVVERVVLRSFPYTWVLRERLVEQRVAVGCSRPTQLYVHHQTLLGRHMTRVRTGVGKTLSAVSTLERLLTAVDADVFLERKTSC